jgi:hypothetical protein
MFGSTSDALESIEWNQSNEFVRLLARMGNGAKIKEQAGRFLKYLAEKRVLLAS